LETRHNVPLDSAEIALLWTQYMNDSLAICMHKHFLSNIEDTEIKSVLEYGLQLSEAHIKKLESILKEEQMVIPTGFTEKDVNSSAPRLFTDAFYLFYVHNMGKIGIEGYSFSLSNSARLDIVEYFSECIHESIKLFNKATEIMLSKGLFIRAPFIPKPKKLEIVQKQSYLTGFFGNKRPINVTEISSIYFNLIRNHLGQALVMGFSQVAESQQVREYMVRGRNIAAKHIEIFGSILSEDQLPSATSWNAQPTDSNISPFSDKLIMFHLLMLNAAGISHYGRSMGSSARRDLGSTYTRLIAEVADYAEDGTNIMINNGWLEQQPQAADRDGLAK